MADAALDGPSVTAPGRAERYFPRFWRSSGLVFALFSLKKYGALGSRFYPLCCSAQSTRFPPPLASTTALYIAGTAAVALALINVALAFGSATQRQQTLPFVFCQPPRGSSGYQGCSPLVHRTFTAGVCGWRLLPFLLRASPSLKKRRVGKRCLPHTLRAPASTPPCCICMES